MDKFQLVRIKTDKYIERGLQKGAIGVVLECYDESNFEVEFSDEYGFTIDIGAYSREDLEIVTEN